VIAADDAMLACHLASVSLNESSDGGKRGKVDVDVQCSPTMVDKETAITDCGMVCSLYHLLLIVQSI